MFLKKEEVIKIIGKNNWIKFEDFMFGQTVGWTDNQPDYYECDVENFLNKLKGKRTFFD